MSIFLQSPDRIKSGIVLLDSASSDVLRTIAPQANSPLPMETKVGATDRLPQSASNAAMDIRRADHHITAMGRRAAR